MDNLEEDFELLAKAIKVSEQQKSSGHAQATAERCGLVKCLEPESGKPNFSPRWGWEKKVGDRTLYYEWRFYDQSKPFSIRPDMNIMTVELRQDRKIVRHAEGRFED